MFGEVTETHCIFKKQSLQDVWRCLQGRLLWWLYITESFEVVHEKHHNSHLHIKGWLEFAGELLKDRGLLLEVYSFVCWRKGKVCNSKTTVPTVKHGGGSNNPKQTSKLVLLTRIHFLKWTSQSGHQNPSLLLLTLMAKAANIWPHFTVKLWYHPIENIRTQKYKEYILMQLKKTTSCSVH